MDTKKLRDLALNGNGTASPHVPLLCSELLALLDENDSLRAEVERLRAMPGQVWSESLWRAEHGRLRQQLSAALAAKDEACEIGERMVEALEPSIGSDYGGARARLHELRSIGKDGGNG